MHVVSAEPARTPFTSVPAQLTPRALSKPVFDVSLLENCDTYTSNSYEQFNVPMLGHSHRNNFGLPRVRMARTKQTACRDPDDRRRDDDRHGDDRRSEERRGREPPASTT